MLNLHFHEDYTQGHAGGGHAWGGDTRGVGGGGDPPIPDDVNRLQLFHGSVRGSARIPLPVGPSQHAGQAVGERLCLRARVAVFVTVFVRACACV